MIEAFSPACARPMHSSKRLVSTSLKLIELLNYNRKIKVTPEKQLLLFEKQTVMSILYNTQLNEELLRITSRIIIPKSERKKLP